jgi:hypothetical protein
LTIISSRPAGRLLAGHVVLQGGQLDQVAVALGAEVDAVRVGDQLDRAVRQPEVEQADARDVAGVGVRLKGGDRRGPRGRVPAQPVHDPGHLVTPGVLVVEQPGRVAVRVAEGGHPGVVGEVGVHPGQPLGFGAAGDDLVGRVGPLHGERHQRDLAHRQAVVTAGDALGQDPAGHREPGRADGVRVQRLRAVAGQSYRHDRMVRTAAADLGRLAATWLQTGPGTMGRSLRRRPWLTSP